MRFAAIILAASLALGGAAQARKTLPTADSASPPPAVQGIEARPLAEIALYPERDASASVVALNESRIAAEISGRIEEIAVEPGQTI